MMIPTSSPLSLSPAGDLVCSSCDAGKYSATGASVCINCMAGNYNGDIQQNFLLERYTYVITMTVNKCDSEFLGTYVYFQQFKGRPAYALTDTPNTV